MSAAELQALAAAFRQAGEVIPMFAFGGVA